MRCLRSLAALSALTLFAGCAAPARAPSPLAVEWGPGTTDLRKATALVRVAPPPQLKTELEVAAARVDDPDVSSFLRGSAAGGFGSGFLVVHSSSEGSAAFVVTNRHVIEESVDAEVSFSDGTTFKDCNVIFASAKYDLAVLALPDAALRALGPGLRPAEHDASDRESVVAAGYPGVAGHPSYQITEGKVSNAKVSLSELGLDDAFVQHTAPIDLGSSGGPLTDEGGSLVGVNVMLLRGRASMFFAVPSAAVVETVRSAHALLTKKRSADWMNAELDRACGDLASELATTASDLHRVETYVSNEAIAERGLESYMLLSDMSAFGPLVRRAFYREPIETLRKSISTRLSLRTTMGGGATGACDKVHATSEELASGKAIRRSVLTKDGSAVALTWTFEHGAWRVANGDLLEDPGPPPATPAPAKTKVATKTKAVKP